MSKVFSTKEISSEKRGLGQTSESSLTDCHFFLTTYCAKGALCPFRHQEYIKQNPNTPDCRYWQNYSCANVNCKYRHPPRKANPKDTICYFYVNETCRSGDRCPFIHPYTARKPNPKEKHISLDDLDGVPRKPQENRDSSSFLSLQTQSKSNDRGKQVSKFKYVAPTSTQPSHPPKEEIRKNLSKRPFFARANQGDANDEKADNNSQGENQENPKESHDNTTGNQSLDIEEKTQYTEVEESPKRKEKDETTSSPSVSNRKEDKSKTESPAQKRSEKNDSNSTTTAPPDEAEKVGSKRKRETSNTTRKSKSETRKVDNDDDLSFLDGLV